jgi:hypothetical protein
MDMSNFYHGNPKHGTQAERAATAQALGKLRSIISAARTEAAGEAAGESRPCSVFDDTFASKDAATTRERQRVAKAVALYLASWVEPLLDAANGSMHGGTTLDQRMVLEENLRRRIQRGGDL